MHVSLITIALIIIALITIALITIALAGRQPCSHRSCPGTPARLRPPALEQVEGVRVRGAAPSPSPAVAFCTPEPMSVAVRQVVPRLMCAFPRLVRLRPAAMNGQEADAEWMLAFANSWDACLFCLQVAPALMCTQQMQCAYVQICSIRTCATAHQPRLCYAPACVQRSTNRSTATLMNL